MLLLSLALSAHADAAPCESAYVSAVVPANGRADAPTDAAPAILLWPGSCGGEATFTAALSDADGVVLATGAADLSDPIIELPTVDFTPGATYAVHVDSTGDYVTTADSSFTAGADLAVGGAPTPTSVESGFSWSETSEGSSTGILSVWIDAAPGADADDMRVLSLSGAGLTPAYIAPTDDQNVRLSGFATTERPDGEVCVQLGQRNALGEWTTVDVCDTPEIYLYNGDTGGVSGDLPCGCATANPAGGLLLTVLAALWSRRR